LSANFLAEKLHATAQKLGEIPLKEKNGKSKNPSPDKIKIPALRTGILDNSCGRF